ncbi:sensor histidine kinase [Enterovirga rhinocerotis]|uniref:histidine kinase n=1 Tax=Enterovirga rhinocerotis TaxID=1339210 RepID=A0A4R7BR71_9HYPH|nr:sensor histidine kinase [Enterovirga rhinocerotis]TDR88174.1 signal transduction histidine kinase [Enterovirga rhinocerotis]
MSRHSLRLRLVLAASGLVALALLLAGFGLVFIFDRILDRRTADDLDRTARYLTGQVRLSPSGSLSLPAEPADPRFATPYGGLYWQIAAPGGAELRSRSLWDAKLSLPVPEAGSASRRLDLAGPDGQRLIAVIRLFALERAGGDVPIAVAVALDRRELAGSRAEFVRLIVPSLGALGLVLALAMWVFVERALRPFHALRDDLRAIREGRRATLPENVPDEVRPLVDGLNQLIEAQDKALARARMQAGDMAHGLKTPLAVLAALARRVVGERPEISGAIDEQVLLMGRQVERSLARARVAAARALGRRSCPVAPVAERLVGALRRLPEADSLRWEVVIPASVAYPAEEGDVTEMLGNLLDNARKWAHRRVRIAAEHRAGRSILTVEDDGPGMSEAAIARIGRGRRWDESVPGTGFGLAIAADIAEETGATLDLGRSPLGGLKVELSWRDVRADTDA